MSAPKKTSKQSRADLALALAVLATIPAPKCGLSQFQLAELCGCSRNAIWMIEDKALKKLRRLAKHSELKEAR